MNRPLTAVALAALLAAPAASPAQDLDTIARAEWPAVSRVWSGIDYLAAGKLLAEGRAPVPRLTDPEGAALVARLTAVENFQSFLVREVPIQARLQVFVGMIQGAGQALNAYLRLLTDPAGGAGAPHQEFARLLGFVVRLAAHGVDLVEEFLPTVPRDETYPSRMEGLKTFRSGLTTMVVGAEASLADTKVFTPADLSVIVEGLAEALPRLRKALARDVVIELRRKLERDRQRFAGEDGARLDAMVRLLAEQEAESPAGAPPAPPRATPEPGAEAGASRG